MLSHRSNLLYRRAMNDTGNSNEEARSGHPRISSTDVTVRLTPDQLAGLDEWARHNGSLTRPEAARRLIARGLGSTSKMMRGS